MQIECGDVTEYDATTKTYTVSLDNHGDVLARRLLTGIDKPYPRFTRVVCIRTRGLEWTIIGEVDTPQPDPGENRPKTVDETTAELDSLVREIRIAARAGELPNFRPAGERVQFAGDASLENRTLDQRSRSFLKVFSFGAVLSFASNLCFTLWDKRNSQVITRARSWLLGLMGYSESITTRSDDPRTTRRELIQANPLPSQQGTGNPVPPRDDRETIEGFIPAPAGSRAEDFAELMTKPKAEYGCRTRHVTHRVEEIDNETQTRRIRQDFVTYDSRGKETDRVTEVTYAEGNVGGEGEGDAKFGMRLRFRDWLFVEIDNELRTLRITNLMGENHVIVMTEKETSLEHGEQYLRLDAEGMRIKVENMHVDVARELTRKAGQRISDEAPQIHHN